MIKLKIKNKARGLWSEREFKTIDLYIFCLSLILCFSICRPLLFAQEKIIAIVNNDIITQKDLDDFVSFVRLQMESEYPQEELENKIQSMKADLLEKLIEDRLILSQAKKSDIKIDETRIKARLGEIKKRYGSDAQFWQALKSQGMVQADLESKIKDEMLMYAIIDARIRSKIAVTPAEVTDFYQKQSSDFKAPETWEFDAVSVEDKDRALEISNGIKNGASLDGLAAKYSLAINKLSMRRGQLKKDVEDVIFKLKPQNVSAPVKIENNYYIFRLTGIIPARQQNLSESQDVVHTLLYNNKMQKHLSEWLDGLKKESYIKIIQD